MNFRYLKDVDILGSIHKKGEVFSTDSYDKVSFRSVELCLGYKEEPVKKGILYWPLILGEEIESADISEKDKRYLCEKIDSEGFDYTFIHYSSFKDIDDPQFHALRKAYIEAHNKLAQYIGLNQ